MSLTPTRVASVVGTAAIALAVCGSPALGVPEMAGVTLMASLSGSAEVPGPGDPDGAGTFNGRLNVGQGQLCYTLTSSNLGTRTMAHIHAGAPGHSGPPVVTLEAQASTRTCTAVAKDVAQKLVAKPGEYYVNIHTTDHPAGAIRGQLMKH